MSLLLQEASHELRSSSPRPARPRPPPPLSEGTTNELGPVGHGDEICLIGSLEILTDEWAFFLFLFFILFGCFSAQRGFAWIRVFMFPSSMLSSRPGSGPSRPLLSFFAVREAASLPGGASRSSRVSLGNPRAVNMTSLPLLSHRKWPFIFKSGSSDPNISSQATNLLYFCSSCR